MSVCLFQINIGGGCNPSEESAVEERHLRGPQIHLHLRGDKCCWNSPKVRETKKQWLSYGNSQKAMNVTAGKSGFFFFLFLSNVSLTN